MTNIGCDIGKSNLDVFIVGKYSKFENTCDGIEKLILKIKRLDDPRIILEPTGGYERSLLKELFSNQRSESVVNPYYVRNFAKSKRDLAKTDKIDSKVLSE
ncbi:MAG: IS110 family transposase [Holosporaceae bacterium]|jgi:transposase|nr:IS110 family transposase [Holosporaceae bacterium]